jgi:RHS repeat-associated protein
MRTDTYYTSAANRFKTEWVYDGLGRVRVRKDYYWYEPYGQWTLSEEVRYIYDGMSVIRERNSGNTPPVSYTRGRDLSGRFEGAGGIGGLLARSHGYSGGTWSTHSFYHADGNGNITMLVNSSQSAVATYRYDPYGNTLHSSGTLAGANLQRFSSKLALDVPSMALYYYGYRFYAPDLQRWVNRDPIGEQGGINLYGLVRNNPVNYRDLWGFDEGRVACDGNGNWAAFFPSQPRNRQKCAELHERQHLDDLRKSYPDACKGQPLGENPLAGVATYRRFWCESECEAHKISKKCHEDIQCDPGYTLSEKQDSALLAYAADIAIRQFCDTEECMKRKGEKGEMPPHYTIMPLSPAVRP